MPANLDKKMLSGFSREVKSYLPSIREGIQNFRNDSSQHEALEETLRYIHTIKGASALMGLVSLSQITSYVEELLEEIMSGNIHLDSSRSQWLELTIEQIDPYLECLLNGEGESQQIISEIEREFLEIKNTVDISHDESNEAPAEPHVEECIDATEFHETIPEHPESLQNTPEEQVLDSASTMMPDSDEKEDLNNDAIIIDHSDSDIDRLHSETPDTLSIDNLDESSDYIYESEAGTEEPDVFVGESQVDSGEFHDDDICNHDPDTESEIKQDSDDSTELLDENLSEIISDSQNIDIDNEEQDDNTAPIGDIQTQNYLYDDYRLDEIEQADSQCDYDENTIKETYQTPEDSNIEKTHDAFSSDDNVEDEVYLSDEKNVAEAVDDQRNEESAILDNSNDSDHETYSNTSNIENFEEKELYLNEDEKDFSCQSNQLSDDDVSNLESNFDYIVEEPNQSSESQIDTINGENTLESENASNIDSNFDENQIITDQQNDTVEANSQDEYEINYESSSDSNRIEEAEVEFSSNINTGSGFENIVETSSGSGENSIELERLIETIDSQVGSTYQTRDQTSLGAAKLLNLNHSQRYLLFTVGESYYAATVANILEIGRVPSITPVPNVPAWLAGIINLRGEILSVIDLGHFLGVTEPVKNDDNRLLVVRTEGGEVITSLIVDQVNGFIQLEAMQKDASSMLFHDKVAPYLSGIFEFEGMILATLDLERFLQSSEICQFY